MRAGHIFAGCGGALYADRILGHQSVWAVEWDDWRCDRLEDGRRAGWWPELEVIRGDARAVDYRALRGSVDCLAAAIPCPRWSTARRGVGDPDDHTTTVVRAVDLVRPEWVFIECVAGYVAEHGRLRRDLAGIGYTLARPLILDAAAIGAPHARARYWALGHADGDGEPMRPVHGEVAELPAPRADPWEADPAWLRVADGLADRGEWLEALGDGQVPLCAAAAWLLLGGPVEPGVLT
jgi:site-specific DNA-cytosine methylase